MEAQCRGAKYLSFLFCLFLIGNLQAASDRTENFIVNAPTREFARQVAHLAERYRRDLAIEWLGQELPRWRQPCPISVQVSPELGAGGATSFMFDRGRPFGWRMSIQGSPERILDSVLPHEVTHTIFATYFGRPLPRWADEGACTAVEHNSEKSKQEMLLNQFLRTKPSRGIPFNRMYAMREYPSDIMPLYSQGFSVVRYLLNQGGKRKFVQYLGEGMQHENWDAVTQKYYGHRDLSELQLSWLDWVEAGSTNAPDRSLIASTTPQSTHANTASQGHMPPIENPPREFTPGRELATLSRGQRSEELTAFAANPREVQDGSTVGRIQPVSYDQSATMPHQPRLANLDSETVTRGQDAVEESWYARQRDKFRNKSIFNIGRADDGSRVAFSSFASLSARAKSFTLPRKLPQALDRGEGNLMGPILDLNDPVPPPPARQEEQEQLLGLPLVELGPATSAPKTIEATPELNESRHAPRAKKNVTGKHSARPNAGPKRTLEAAAAKYHRKPVLWSPVEKPLSQGGTVWR